MYVSALSDKIPHYLNTYQNRHQLHMHTDYVQYCNFINNFQTSFVILLIEKKLQFQENVQKYITTNFDKSKVQQDCTKYGTVWTIHKHPIYVNTMPNEMFDPAIFKTFFKVRFQRYVQGKINKLDYRTHLRLQQICDLVIIF